MSKHLIVLVTVVWLNVEATVLYRLLYPIPDEKRSSKRSSTWCDLSRSFSAWQIKDAWKRRRLYRETEMSTGWNYHETAALSSSTSWCYKTTKKKKKVRFWLSSISFLYEMGWKVQERLQDKQHQGRKCSCRQLTGLVPSLWLIQQDKVQTVCTQFWQPN